jgi:hypothetical protein
MPVAAEMDVLDGEVGGDNQILSAAWPQHGAIVTNAKGQAFRCALVPETYL